MKYSWNMYSHMSARPDVVLVVVVSHRKLHQSVMLMTCKQEVPGLNANWNTLIIMAAKVWMQL
jgi:hypothetical protein